MHERSRRRLQLAVTVSLVAAGVVLALPAQTPVGLHAREKVVAAVGMAVFGVSVFAAGYLAGHRARTGAVRLSDEERKPAANRIVSPEEAKYWLQRFLEEHQKKVGPVRSRHSAIR